MTWLFRKREQLQAADEETTRIILGDQLESFRDLRRTHDELFANDILAVGPTLDALILALETALEFGWSDDGVWKELEVPWLYFVIAIEALRQRGAFEARMVLGITSANKRRESSRSKEIGPYLEKAYDALLEERGKPPGRRKLKAHAQELAELDGVPPAQITEYAANQYIQKRVTR